MDVVVQIPAYEEGRQLTTTAEQIVAQPEPGFASVDVEAWVTLSPPDKSLCDTWQAGMAARGVDTFEAPAGKLTARNAAHDSALSRGYDVIVPWDADAPPIHDDTLTELLRPINNREDVVAVNSRPVAATDPDVIARLTDITGYALDRINPHIHGQCHALTAEAWQTVGPFDDSIDQTTSTVVRREEEFDFYDRLAEIGTVVDQRSAEVFNDTRRTRCRVPLLGDSEFCSRRSGTTTFDSQDRR